MISPQVKYLLLFMLAAAVGISLFLSRVPSEVDALYIGGTVYTMNEDNSVAEAIAVRGDRIVAVGTTENLRRKYRARREIDLEGMTVLPGFIDAHAHFVSLGVARMTVDVTGARSESEAALAVRERVVHVEPGVWIRGRGWDQNLWPTRNFPSHRALDVVAPENPVYLTRVDGHAVWVNRRALEIAGITAATADPPGGLIVRDAAGNPTGVLIDAAMRLVADHLPAMSEAEIEEAVRLASEECLRVGLTSVHDMGVTAEEIRVFKKLAARGELPVRLYVAIEGDDDAWHEFRSSGPLIGFGNNRLTVRSVKLYVDGALGSRGAALVEPYSDDPTHRGLTLASEADIRDRTIDALEHGFQVCTHAIGDRGNNIVLNAYEGALKATRVRDHRLRIEHAQVLLPSDIPRFKELGIIPSMQPTHCTSDMYWAEARLGPQRVRTAYAWRSLLNTGTIICGGSDFPVEQPNPLYGIYAAVTRQDQEGYPRNARDVELRFQLSSAGIVDEDVFEGGWYSGERMDRGEAVRAFTTWAAYGAFEEELKGSFEKGKLADFVVLSDDVFRVPAGEILNIEVMRTYVGGEEKYRSEAAMVGHPKSSTNNEKTLR